MLQNGFYQPTPQDRPTLDRLDTDGDRQGVVRRVRGVLQDIHRAAVSARSRPMAENPTNAAVTEALFKLLDANGDGKLTKDEVKAIEKLLATHDADEDECLSLAELVPNLRQPAVGRGQNSRSSSRAPGVPANPLASQTVMTRTRPAAFPARSRSNSSRSTTRTATSS